MTALPVALISHPEPAPILRPFAAAVTMQDVLRMAQVVAVAKLAHEADKLNPLRKGIYDGAMDALQDAVNEARTVENFTYTTSRRDYGRRVVVLRIVGGVVSVYAESMR